MARRRDSLPALRKRLSVGVVLLGALIGATFMFSAPVLAAGAPEAPVTREWHPLLATKSLEFYDTDMAAGNPQMFITSETQAEKEAREQEEAAKKLGEEHVRQVGEEAAAQEAARKVAEEVAARVRHEEEAAAAATRKRQQEEAAASHAREEEVQGSSRRPHEALATGGIALANTSIAVQPNGTALVKLECLGIASCRGKLKLRAKGTDGAKGTNGKIKARAVSIGSASFSIAGDETKTVKLDLNAAGRALLGADHGRLNASLQILELAPGPKNTQVKAVRLVRQR